MMLLLFPITCGSQDITSRARQEGKCLEILENWANAPCPQEKKQQRWQLPKANGVGGVDSNLRAPGFVLENNPGKKNCERSNQLRVFAWKCEYLGFLLFF